MPRKPAAIAARALAATAVAATALAAFAGMSGPAAAQDIKIGFLGTFTGPLSAVGNDMRAAVELALDKMDRKMGGRPVSIIYEDDQLKPDLGKQKTDKLIQSDRVDLLTGYISSAVLLASIKSAVDAQTFLVGANAGPSQIAAELCTPWFFSTSWQGDQVPQAIGEYMNQKGVKSAFLIAPNYAAGKDVIAGVKANYKGNVVGEEYTRWPDQLDFSAELTKARTMKPDAVFAFYPGVAGVQFMTQYAQAGLKGQIPLYTSFIIDALSLPRLKDLVVGVPSAQHWGPDLPNEANKTFVNDFEIKHKRTPSFYASQAYDAINLIASAVNAVKGDVSKKDEMRAEMKKAHYASVRGPYAYGNNHFPIQNFYLQEAVKAADGSYALKTVATTLTEHQDRYHDRCPMN
jgi:branched-chain amino acid transport system substrate-binding protein